MQERKEGGDRRGGVGWRVRGGARESRGRGGGGRGRSGVEVGGRGGGRGEGSSRGE